MLRTIIITVLSFLSMNSIAQASEQYAILINQDSEEERHINNLELATNTLLSNGYDPCNIYALSDQNKSSNCPSNQFKANKANLKLLVENVENVLEEDDSLLIYITGHNDPDVITLASKEIPHTSFKKIFSSLKPLDLILIVDTCYAETLTSNMTKATNWISFAGCSKDREMSCSLFTPVFWQNLAGPNQSINNAFEKANLEYRQYVDNGEMTPNQAKVAMSQEGIVALSNGTLITPDPLEWQQTVSASELDDIFLRNHRPVLIDVYASWCQPCKFLDRDLRGLQSEYHSTIDAIKVDGDSEAIQQWFIENTGSGINALPALFMVKNGGIISSQVGYDGRENLVQFIEDSLDKPIEDLPSPGWLGVSIQELNLSKHPNGVATIVDHGIEVLKIFPNTPAEAYGMLPGDVILELNNKQVTGLSSFIADIKSHNAGETVVLKILRRGYVLEYAVQLGKRPNEL